MLRQLSRNISLKFKKLVPKSTFKKSVLVAAGLLLVLTFFSGDFGFVRIAQLKQKKKTLQLRHKQLQAEVLQLEDQKNLLQNDPYYIEKLAREKFGYSRPDEKVYRFLPSQDSSLSQP